MCISIKTKFDDKLTYANLLKAHQKTREGKTTKDRVIRFEINLETNMYNLYNNLKNGTYKVGNYNKFIIKMPRPREVQSLPYVDKIVHNWYVEEFLKPYYSKRFINASYGGLEGKGTYVCIQDMQKMMRKAKRNYGDDYYILKMDIKSFFYSIDPHILYKILSRVIADEKLRDFTRFLIFDHNNENEVGIPIGNYTSQYFANIYMNELDKYVKTVLRVKYYSRYMDDFILLLKNKNECIEKIKQIKKFLEENLKLELNEKTKYYPRIKGCNYCGYIIYETHIKIRKRSVKKIKKNIKHWNKLYSKKKINFNKTLNSLNSWFGHIKHANSYKLKNTIINKCDFIYNENNDCNYI